MTQRELISVPAQDNREGRYGKRREKMLEKSIITGFADEIDSMLDKQLEVIGRLGVSYIEMRGVDGKGLVNCSMEEVREIKKRLENQGVRLSSVGSPIGKIGIQDEFAPHMELLKHTVEIAKELDAPYIRMFSFYIPEGEKPETYREQVMERLGKMADYAASQNITLLHENEKGIYGDNGSRCREIMEAFYGEHFKAVFDFANFVQCRQNTLEAYEMLKDYIEYIHVKDAVWEDGRVVPAGYGDGHVKEILGLLDAKGYTGFLSLEPHLTEFTGFAQLEEGGKIERKLTGTEAFTLAYDSLMKLLKEQ